MRLLAFLLIISVFATTPAANPGKDFTLLVQSLRQQKLVTRKDALVVHSTAVAPMIKQDYRVVDLARLKTLLAETLTLKVDERGLAKASDRTGDSTSDPTHYDAVWVRDSLWIYLGFCGLF